MLCSFLGITYMNRQSRLSWRLPSMALGLHYWRGLHWLHRSHILFSHSRFSGGGQILDWRWKSVHQSQIRSGCRWCTSDRDHRVQRYFGCVQRLQNISWRYGCHSVNIQNTKKKLIEYYRLHVFRPNRTCLRLCILQSIDCQRPGLLPYVCSRFFISHPHNILANESFIAISTQLHSVPPWACAFGLAMLTATLSDATRHRFAFVMIPICIAISGFAILLNVHHNVHVEYAALFLIAMGAYSAMPIIGASFYFPVHIFSKNI